MKKILLVVVVLVAVGTLTIEKLRAYAATYCRPSCQDCWIVWDPGNSVFEWGTEVICSAGSVNKCNYSVNLRMWDNGTGQYWTAGTSGWTGCNDFVDARGYTAAPLAMQHGHTYTASITVRDPILMEQLCYDSVSFFWP